MAAPVYGYARLGSGLPKGTYSISRVGLTDENRKAACTLVAATANAITHVRFAAYLAFGTSPTYKASLQGVGADGRPDGSIKAGGNAFGTFAPGSTTSSIFEVALGASYTPSVGEKLAIVFEWSSGTVGFSDSAYVVVCPMPPDCYSQYSAGFDDFGFGGGFTNKAFAGAAQAKTASERYGGVLTVAADSPSTQVGTRRTTTTSGQRVAAKVTLPAADYITSVNISGFLLSQLATSGQVLRAGVWNAAGTELAGVDINTDLVGGDAKAIPVEFDSPITASPGDVLYFGYESVSSSSASIYVLDFDSTADRDAVGSVVSGANVIYSSWNGSAWTDTATDVPLIMVNLSEITGAAGGGSSTYSRGRIVNAGA